MQRYLLSSLMDDDEEDGWIDEGKQLDRKMGELGINVQQINSISGEFLSMMSSITDEKPEVKTNGVPAPVSGRVDTRYGRLSGE